MVFVVVTRWEEIDSKSSLKKIRGSMEQLRDKLPDNYVDFHKHGPDKSFFYPLRALDALLATLGVEGQSLDEERQQAGRNYASRIRSVYPDLVKINPDLRDIDVAQDFQGIDRWQHEAMLEFSHLPELTADLQKFLSESRYEVQLLLARTQTSTVQQQLEDLCWEHLEHLGVNTLNRDMQELQQEIEHRQSRRALEYENEFKRRKEIMERAWSKALREFTSGIKKENNDFHEALKAAHRNATEYVNKLIEAGYFDPHITGENKQKDILSLEDQWWDAAVRALITELRLIFSAAIEQEIAQPARALAKLFLDHIRQKEADGALDIEKLTEHEYSPDLVRLQRDYEDIKRGIENEARRLCLYVTMSELVDEGHKLKKDSPSVVALYTTVNGYAETDKGFFKKVHQNMQAILNDVLGNKLQATQSAGQALSVVERMGLVEDTKGRIALLFHYELEKLMAYQVYDRSHTDTASTRPGKFADLAESIRSVMARLVVSSVTLRKTLEDLLNPHEASIQFWFKFLQDIRNVEENLIKDRTQHAFIPDQDGHIDLDEPDAKQSEGESTAEVAW